MKTYAIRPDQLTKTAARKGLQMLRDLYQKGHLNEAKALEQHLPQMMAGRSSPFSQLKVLGAGGEGVAQLVATPGARGAVQHAADPLAHRVAGGFASRSNPQAPPSRPQAQMSNPNVAPGSYALKTFDTTADTFNPIVQNLRRQSVGHEHPLIATTHEMGQTPASHAGRKHEYALSEFVPGGQTKGPQEQAVIDQVRHAFPGQTQLDLRGNVVGGKVIDRIPVPSRDVNPHGAADPALEKQITHQLEFDSPTAQAMNYAQPDAPHSLRETMLRRADTQGVLRDDAPLPRKGLNTAQRQQLNQEMSHAERGYGGQLLHEAYGRPSAQRPQVPLTRPAQGAGMIQDAPAPAPAAQAPAAGGWGAPAVAGGGWGAPAASAGGWGVQPADLRTRR